MEYSIFERLLQEKGATVYQVSKATRIAASTFTDWKNGRSSPKSDKLRKIAVKLGLRKHKFIVGIFFHQRNRSSGRALDLLARLSAIPSPFHINVRMTDAGCDHFIVTCQILIQSQDRRRHYCFVWNATSQRQGS